MKKRNYLKGLRVLLAILFFVPILLFFVDFSGVLPDSVHRLLHLQLMPALLGGMVSLIVFQFLLALVFGRIYCSTICPAGVFQDIINRLFCIGKKKKKGSRRFTYHKPMNRLRYVLLVITAVMAVFGLSELCLLLDPYSNFGRIAASLFRPIVMWGNNILAEPADESGQLLVVPCDNQYRDGFRSDRSNHRIACFHRHDCFPRTIVL